MKKNEHLSDQILKIVTDSDYPLTTKEISSIINKARHLTYPRLQKLFDEEKIWRLQLNKWGACVWWRIARTNPELENVNNEIKEFEDKISKLRIEFKKKRKQLIKDKKKHLRNEFEELENWNDFLEVLDKKEDVDEPYRNHIDDLIGVIYRILDDFGDDDEVEEYRKEVENEIAKS